MKNSQNRKKNHLQAFTLAEVLIVLAIMGILFMLVIPNQAGSVAMAKSIEAKSMLNQVHSLEKNHFFMYSKYSMDLNEIGFEQERLTTDGGNANYKIQILESSTSGFVAQAEAVVDFDADGTMNVWQIDQNKNLKEITKD
jgi:type IV pilus assembly protein PilE